MVRRLFALLAIALVPLCALPAGAANIVLMVFPFSLSNGADDTGARLANQMANDIATAGGVTIVHGPPNTKPSDYRTAARAAGADFYYTGSLTKVMTSFAGIEVVVSARNGIAMWSAPIHFHDVTDIVGEGRNVRDIIVNSTATPPPAAPKPTGTVLIGAAPDTPPPSPPPAVPAAGSGYAILPMNGSALQSDKDYARRMIVETFTGRGTRAVTVTGAGGAPIDLVGDGQAVCTQTGARTVLQGTLDTTHVSSASAPSQTTAHVSLTTYDCKARTATMPTIVDHIAPLANDAIHGAVLDAISALASPS